MKWIIFNFFCSCINCFYMWKLACCRWISIGITRSAIRYEERKEVIKRILFARFFSTMSHVKSRSHRIQSPIEHDVIVVGKSLLTKLQEVNSIFSLNLMLSFVWHCTDKYVRRRKEFELMLSGKRFWLFGDANFRVLGILTDLWVYVAIAVLVENCVIAKAMIQHSG